MEHCITIRDYLCREAKRVTDSAISRLNDAETWRQQYSTRHAEFLKMMGLAQPPFVGERLPLPVTVTGIVDRPGYRIEKLYFESLPGLLVTATLYVPSKLAKPAPGILYACGHSQNQKVHYQAHPRRFAELGFVCLLYETVQMGEAPGYHHGPYREGWFHWYSRGYTPAGIELWNGIRGLDLLAGRPEVDAERLGVTGISGGGAASWWIAAADPRVRAAAPVCATATLESHVRERTIDGHCDCMWWINTNRWDLADVGALIAPRPLLIASANRDAINTAVSLRQVYRQLHRLYHVLDAEENLRLVETPGPHAYHERSRTEVFSWFLHHLMDRDIRPEEVGDLDLTPERQETEATLRVFPEGTPPANRNASFHDDLHARPEPLALTDEEALQIYRKKVVSELRETAFGAFPATDSPLDTRIEMEFSYETSGGYRFSFVGEEGWRLRAQLQVADSACRPAPSVVALMSPDARRGDTQARIGKLPAPWARVVVETRGTGETSWGPELQWHLRRAAAWTGRTLASMRVYDTLRALQAVRNLPDVDGDQVSLYAQGEMAAVALYAALLDGGVRAVLLDSPPATQNAPSQPDGTGPAIEMLGCLQTTDLPQVAALLCPTEIVLIGEAPASYSRAQELYNSLGHAERFRCIDDLAAWDR